MTTQETLEQIIDRIGLKNTIELTAIICEEKAEHIRTNWDDKSLAAVWQWSGRLLDQSASKIEV